MISIRVLFTCGGTAGHVNPAIAVANALKDTIPDVKILFVGAVGGMENQLVPREGFDIESVEVRSLRHKLTPGALLYNARTIGKVLGSLPAAKKIVRRFAPDVVLGTGGYASFPVVYEASRLGVPCLIHESNVVPGLTTKMLARYCENVLVSFPAAMAAYKQQEKVLVTGTPVRPAFLNVTQDEAKRTLGLDGRPVLVSVFGSLGARDMNSMMVEFMRLESKLGAFQHIHAAGRLGYQWMPEEVLKAGVDLEAYPEIRLQEYLYDMPIVMAAADVVITRSGASTLAELMATGKPAILVPSPNVTANHQEKNAVSFAESGAALWRREIELDGKSLFHMTRHLLENEGERSRMSESLKKMAPPNAAERIVKLLINTSKRKGNG